MDDLPIFRNGRIVAHAQGRRVGRSYPANEQNYDQVEDCGHVWTCDGLGNSVCEHCGCLEPE